MMTAQETTLLFSRENIKEIPGKLSSLLLASDKDYDLIGRGWWWRWWWSLPVEVLEENALLLNKPNTLEDANKEDKRMSHSTCNVYPVSSEVTLIIIFIQLFREGCLEFFHFVSLFSFMISSACKSRQKSSRSRSPFYVNHEIQGENDTSLDKTREKRKTPGERSKHQHHHHEDHQGEGLSLFLLLENWCELRQSEDLELIYQHM